MSNHIIVGLQSIHVGIAAGDHLACGLSFAYTPRPQSVVSRDWDQDPGLTSEDILCTLYFYRDKDGMARGGFNSLHLSFKSFLGKIAVIQRSKLMSVGRAGQIDLWELELKMQF